MFMPGVWCDWRTTWYAISNWCSSGMESGSLCMTLTDQQSWKGIWWDWAWMATGRSGFETAVVKQCPFIWLERERWVSPMCVCVCVFYNADPTALLRTWDSRARWIYGIECSLFSIHAPLGQTTLRMGWVSVWCRKVEVRVTMWKCLCNVTVLRRVRWWWKEGWRYVCIFKVLGHINSSGHWRPYEWWLVMIMTAKWYSGTLGAHSFLTFVLQVRKNPERNLTQETCPDWGSNPGLLHDRRACCCLAHEGWRWKPMLAHSLLFSKSTKGAVRLTDESLSTVLYAFSTYILRDSLEHNPGLWCTI